MELPEDLEEQLRARGTELREDHDEDIIQDVIEEVENLDDPESAITADILKVMSGLDK